jgi:hydroxypyruvate reductase
MNGRHDLISIFRHALAAVNGATVVRCHLRRHATPRPDAIIALGKAACAMLRGAHEHFGPDIPGLLVTKHGHVTADCAAAPTLRVFEAGHPLPDAASLAAGRALVDFISSLPERAGILFLISGGTSALVEVLCPPLTLADLERANAWLVGSGLDIHAVNAIRKRLSMIKGGKLAYPLGARRAIVLLISDVPGDDPSTIGSGLLFPDQHEVRDDTLRVLPDWLLQQVQRALAAPVAPGASPAKVRHAIVASNAVARLAAARAARAAGYVVHEHARPVTADVMTAADGIAAALLAEPAGLHIWGGEPTVRLPANPGRGGRNQHLALAVARRLAGRSGVWFLAGASDGSDGSTNLAGAVVDGETIGRGQGAGFDATAALVRADSTQFLEAAGATLHTGPTGTNVMDLWLGLRVSAS